jgi:hypothetical protein
MYSTLKQDPPETRGTLDALDHRKFLLLIRDKARAEKGQRKQGIPYIPVNEILARAPSSHQAVIKALVKAILCGYRDKSNPNRWLLAEKGKTKLNAALYSKLKEKPSAPVPDRITENLADSPFYFELLENEKPKEVFFVLIKDQRLEFVVGKEENFNAALQALGF